MYTEYVQGGVVGNVVEPTQSFRLCNYVTDPDGCDFARELDAVRASMLRNKGRADASTPLMKATAQALEAQFGPPGPVSGILLYFTDGAETDGISSERFRDDFPYPFGALCKQESPESDIRSYDILSFCRAIGLTSSTITQRDEMEVLGMFKNLYQSYSCSPAGVPSQYVSTCQHITQFYDSLSDKLIDDAWKTTCINAGTASRPSVANYIKDNYPNLRVFILNLGDRALLACPNDPNGNVQMIPVDNPNGYERAFQEAFKALNTKSADPMDVCNRIRRTYQNAVDY